MLNRPDAEPAFSSPERCTDSVREDRHAELGLTQRAHRVEALRERVHHHCTRPQLGDATRPPEQRLHRPRNVGRVANAVREDGRNRAHAILERTPGRIAEELVVLDQVGAAGGQSGGRRCEPLRGEPERRLDDRADEHLVGRRVGRAG